MKKMLCLLIFFLGCSAAEPIGIPGRKEIPLTDSQIGQLLDSGDAAPLAHELFRERARVKELEQIIERENERR